MDANRTIYESAKKNIEETVTQIIQALGKKDKDISELEARKCIFRQNRDIRFSADKTPYKTAFGAYINKGGKKIQSAGYYFHVEPGNSFIAGGMWHPEKELLANIRQEIDYNAEEWIKLLGDRKLKKIFPEGISYSHTNSRPPQGYEIHHPLLPYIKLKSFVLMKHFSDTEMMNVAMLKTVISAFEALTAFVSFLNRSSE